MCRVFCAVDLVTWSQKYGQCDIKQRSWSGLTWYMISSTHNHNGGDEEVTTRNIIIPSTPPRKLSAIWQINYAYYLAMASNLRSDKPGFWHWYQRMIFRALAADQTWTALHLERLNFQHRKCTDCIGATLINAIPNKYIVGFISVFSRCFRFVKLCSAWEELKLISLIRINSRLKITALVGCDQEQLWVHYQGMVYTYNNLQIYLL